MTDLVSCLRQVPKVSRMRYFNEAATLLIILAAIQLFPGTMPRSAYAAGIVGAAPLLLNALGIIIVYRANRFINFSQVAFGAFAGIVFDGLVRGHGLLRGLNGICNGCVGAPPGRTARAVNFWLAFGLSITIATLLAWLTYMLLVQRFRRSPILVLTIVSVFIAQTLAGAEGKVQQKLVPDALVQKQLADAKIIPPIDSTLMVAGYPVHLPQVLLLLAALAALIGLSVFLRKSDTGSAIRACAENPSRAQTLGVNTAAVTGRVWAIAGLLSGIVGVLGAYMGGAGNSGSAAGGTGIPIQTLVLSLVVVVLARFVNLWVAGAGALVLSILQAAVQSAFSSQAPLQAAYVFIIGGMLLLQRSRVNRAEREDFSGLEMTQEVRPIPRVLAGLPVVGKYVRLSIVSLALVLLGLPFTLSVDRLSLVTDSLFLTIAGLSLLILTGWAGQVSLGQWGFAAIGAWAAACSGLPFFVAILVGGLAGAVAAVIVGLPALKLRGLNLAISTLAFAISAQALFIDDRYLGSMLPASLTPPNVLGVDFADEKVYYYFTLVIVITTCLLLVGLRRTRTGRVLIAIRSNEAAGQSFGVNLLRVRLTAFVVSGFLAALAGALLAYHLGRVAPEAYAPDRSLTVFLYSVIGGLGGIAGPLLGFAYYAIITFFFSANPLIQFTANGVGAMMLMYAAPGGLAQFAYGVRDAMLRRVAYRLRIPVPSLMGDRGAADSLAQAQLDEKRSSPRRAGDSLPIRYKPAGQWALERLGTHENKERVGVR